jgi:hypothetical protein
MKGKDRIKKQTISGVATVAISNGLPALFSCKNFHTYYKINNVKKNRQKLAWYFYCITFVAKIN